MKYLLVLGNGFSLDLFSHLDPAETMPLTNLASYGDKLNWPANGQNAFISFRHTPNLWILGIRPSNSADKNNRIIENIITCANAYYLKSPSARSFGKADKRSIYIDAYRELVVYLKYLFVFFDDITSITKSAIENWHWAKLLLALYENTTVDEINIITFNYDVWLERTLEALGISYRISVIPNTSAASKISITKPHGSISFIHKKHLDPAAFAINYTNDYLEGETEDFEIKLTELNKNTPIIPLIPPAGDSARFKLTWAGEMRTETIAKAKSLSDGDKVVLCGISYWHVDRSEIDNILLNVSDNVELALINPTPPDTFDAVLTSLFNKYEHYTSIERYIGGNNHA